MTLALQMQFMADKYPVLITNADLDALLPFYPAIWTAELGNQVYVRANDRKYLSSVQTWLESKGWECKLC